MDQNKNCEAESVVFLWDWLRGGVTVFGFRFSVFGESEVPPWEGEAPAEPKSP